MRSGDRSKSAGRIGRYESQRIRIVLITMGCFLMTMTFILSTKPGSVLIDNAKLDEADSLFPSPKKSKSQDFELDFAQMREDFLTNNKRKTEPPENFKAVAVDLESIDGNTQGLQSEHARSEIKPAEETKIGDADSESRLTMRVDDEPMGETEKIIFPGAGANNESEELIVDDTEHTNNLQITLSDQTNTEENKNESIVTGNEETNGDNSEEDKTKPARVPSLLDRFNENLLELKPINVENKTIDTEKTERTDKVVPTDFEHFDKDPALAKQTESEQSGSEKSVDQWFITNAHKTEERLNSIPGLQCDFTDFRSDTCNLEGDVRIHANSSTVYFVDPSGSSNQFYKIKPYPRKGDEMCNQRVVEFTVASRKEAPQCSKSSDVPAILFSIGGYTGNIFHDFSDVIMPLFTASRPFKGKVQFLMTNTQTWWLIKYNKILKALSNFEPIRLDVDEANNKVHCFKHVIVGLVAHRELIIEPLRNPKHYSTKHFTRFLRQIFPLKREGPTRLGEDAMKTPRMLIISRARSRMITNLHQLVGLGQELGFEVLVKETDVGNDIVEFAQLINSCDVLIGVHGAGLTNEMFLPPNGTLIQIVPYGGLDWIGQMDYGDPAIAMGLNYIQYSIALEESSLLEKYGRDNEILKNPTEFHKRGFVFIHEFFMNGQNITLNLDRFRNVLITTLDKLTY